MKVPLPSDFEKTREEFNAKKREEERLEQGDQIELQCALPDGSTHAHRVPAGATVAFVKMIIEQNHGHESAKQVLKLGDKTLIDPLSLRDYVADNAAKIEVQLK